MNSANQTSKLPSTLSSSPKSNSNAAPLRSLNRQTILDEDEYTTALSHIIARDFFPSLVHLDATNDYLDALQSRDPHLINASVRRLQDISSTPSSTSRRRGTWQTPSQTPYGGGPSDTPFYTGAGPRKRARYDADLSLDEFQARYTSEDNSSFTQILDDENRKRKERWAWAWDAQKRVGEQREKMIEARERRLNEVGVGPGVREKFVIEALISAGSITDGRAQGEENNDREGGDGAGKELVESAKGKEVAGVKQAEGEKQVDVMAPKKDTRSAGVDAWKFKTRNSLMFSPDADMSPYHPPLNQTDAGGDPKSIRHISTRLPSQDDSSIQSRGMSAPPSPTRSRIDAAISGTPYRHGSPTNAFSLVPTMPSPTPSELGPAAVKQLMTWGTLNATPRIISTSDEPDVPQLVPSTPFHLPAISSREVISHRLSNSASRSLRTKAGLLGGVVPAKTPRTGLKGSGTMAPPSWTPRRADAAGSLTPAAKRLLDRTTMGTAAARRAEAMGRIAGWEVAGAKEKDLNRVRWTPTPSTAARKG